MLFSSKYQIQCPKVYFHREAKSAQLENYINKHSTYVIAINWSRYKNQQFETAEDQSDDGL
jgi:hypothetical protein